MLLSALLFASQRLVLCQKGLVRFLAGTHGAGSVSAGTWTVPDVRGPFVAKYFSHLRSITANSDLAGYIGMREAVVAYVLAQSNRVQGDDESVIRLQARASKLAKEFYSGVEIASVSKARPRAAHQPGPRRLPLLVW